MENVPLRVLDGRGQLALDGVVAAGIPAPGIELVRGPVPRFDRDPHPAQPVGDPVALQPVEQAVPDPAAAVGRGDDDALDDERCVLDPNRGVPGRMAAELGDEDDLGIGSRRQRVDGCVRLA